MMTFAHITGRNVVETVTDCICTVQDEPGIDCDYEAELRAAAHSFRHVGFNYFVAHVMNSTTGRPEGDYIFDVKRDEMNFIPEGDTLAKMTEEAYDRANR